MASRLYSFNETGPKFPQHYYQTVLDNPKANVRIKKKAGDIIAELGRVDGHPQLCAAASGNFSFEQWKHARNKYRSKRNIGILGKRHKCNVPLITDYQRYMSYAKWVMV